MLEELALYLGFGCLAGILSGLLGIGGGVVIVPFLVWYFTRLDFPPDAVMIMAVATSLATIVVTSVSSASAHHRRGAVDWPVVMRLAPGILAGSMLGSVIADQLPTRWFEGVFAAFLLIIALRMMAGRTAEPVADSIPNARGYTVAGAVIGVLSSILGIGGGALSVPFLARRGVPLRRAVAVSSACGFPIALAGAVTYVALGGSRTGLPPWSLGYVYLPALVGIMLTSVPFAPLGAHLAHRWPVRRLRRVLAIIIALGGAKLLWQALSL